MTQIIHLPVVDMRAEPGYPSKVVSQALFGEEIQIKEKIGDRVLIETPDGYSGWVADGAFITRDRVFNKDLELTRLRAHIYAMPDTEFGPLITLPYGCKLHALENIDSRWLKVQLVDGKEAYVQKGDVDPEPHDLISFSKKFLGLPYTWGGRSSFGYDCSGFVQMLYAQRGIHLPRDASQQILDRRAVQVKIEQLTAGDLIFWGKSEHEIKHVGMSLGRLEFIHTSVRENKPYLRISSLTDLEWSGRPDVFYPFRTARRIAV